jgi:peptide/nickel transport system substrate-binding protein
MGGAMDLCAGVKKIIVATDHCEKSGESKILKKCTLPLTGAKCVTDIVTERCYFEITPEGKSWDDIDPVRNQVGVVWGFGSADPYEIQHQYDSRVAGEGYDNPEVLNDSSVDTYIDSAMSQDLNSSYATWSQAAQQANSNYPYLWIGTVDYAYFVDDSLDISNGTHLIYPHGGDIWGNIYDWKRVNATS